MDGACLPQCNNVQSDLESSPNRHGFQYCRPTLFPLPSEPCDLLTGASCSLHPDIRSRLTFKKGGNDATASDVADPKAALITLSY